MCVCVCVCICVCVVMCMQCVLMCMCWHKFSFAQCLWVKIWALLYLYAALLVKRHSGVLGLAALIGACPYTVPDWLPEVIAEMAMHQHDPAPLQVRL